jgi:hypothetical protein
MKYAGNFSRLSAPAQIIREKRLAHEQEIIACLSKVVPEKKF